MRSILRAAAVAAASIAIYFFCIEPYRANFIVEALTQRTLGAQSAEAIDAAPVARGNLNDLNAIRRVERLNPSWYLLYGSNCEILGQKNEALEAYSQALRIDQRPEIYTHRGMVLLQLGRVDDAVRDLATAARFDPFVLYDLDSDLRKRVAAAARHH